MTSNDQRKATFPHYGDVYDVELNPVVGSEIGKRRPALVVSNNINNQYAATITVLPISGTPVRKLYPFEVGVRGGVAGLSKDSRIKADQIRTVDKTRLVQYRGTLPAPMLQSVKSAVKVHLNMETP